MRLPQLIINSMQRLADGNCSALRLNKSRERYDKERRLQTGLNKESRSRKGDPQRIKSILTVMNEEQKNEQKKMKFRNVEIPTFQFLIKFWLI